MSEREYFAREHVIVSYNADLRSAIEDWLHKERRVRCAVSSFSHVGSLITGSSLLATGQQSYRSTCRSASGSNWRRSPSLMKWQRPPAKLPTTRTYFFLITFVFHGMDVVRTNRHVRWRRRGHLATGLLAAHDNGTGKHASNRTHFYGGLDLSVGHDRRPGLVRCCRHELHRR